MNLTIYIFWHFRRRKSILFVCMNASRLMFSMRFLKLKLNSLQKRNFQTLIKCCVSQVHKYHYSKSIYIPIIFPIKFKWFLTNWCRLILWNESEKIHWKAYATLHRIQLLNLWVSLCIGGIFFLETLIRINGVQCYCWILIVASNWKSDQAQKRFSWTSQLSH